MIEYSELLAEIALLRVEVADVRERMAAKATVAETGAAVVEALQAYERRAGTRWR